MPLRDKIKASKPTVETIQAWGETVYVRGLSGAERVEINDLREQAIEERAKKAPVILEVSALMIRSCVLDLQYQPVFTESDHEWLKQQDAPTLDRLTTTIARLSGLSQESKDDAKKN